MEATEKRPSLQVRRLLGTRSGTLALAAGIAVLAGLVLVAFLSQYKDSVRGGTTTSTALVAGSLIPKGTSGDVVIGEKLFKTGTFSDAQLNDGALSDTAALAGKVATRDVYPGQQIKASDFSGNSDSVRGKLTGDQRAIAIPVDPAHGLVGEVRAGDRVDVLAGFNAVSTKTGTGRPVVRTLLQNVLVLGVPKSDDSSSGVAEGGDTANITIRATDQQAAAVAFAADNGKVWLVLRPPAGASQQKPAIVNLEALLAGSEPITNGGSR
jgi:Flp pilus assembly protein CpaB